jgi:serpin B
MKKYLKPAAIISVILLVFQFTPAVAGAVDVTKTARANNAFAFEIFSPLCAQKEGKNVFISPYSISCALAMTYEGAAKNTAAQMKAVMKFPDGKDALKAGYFGILEILNKKNAAYQLASANSLWPQKGFDFSKDYMAVIEKYYGGKAEPVDFAGDKPGALSKINGWTSKKTADKIPEILGPDDVNELTRMVLVNAIYFKGTWSERFEKKNTKKADFHVSAGKKIKTNMMNAEKSFGYAELDGVKALEMDYNGDGLSMMLFMPASKEGSFAKGQLSLASFERWRAALSRTKVIVSIPKFRVRSLYSLKKPLQALGMTDAFSENLADFSGMTGRKNLYMTDVIHAGFIDVNEEGTEAAAATAVVMGLKRAAMEFETPEFIADHPFVFVIYDKRADTILFMGRITDPAKEGEK